MRAHHILFVGCIVAAGCGGGSSIEGEPLISGSGSGSWEGSSYTVKFGVASPYMSAFVILLGSDPINCDSITAPNPPPGDSFAFLLPTLDVGPYSGLDVQLYHNVGSFHGIGSNHGSVQITASTDMSVAATLSYSDTIDTKMYAASGTVEVMRCP